MKDNNEIYEMLRNMVGIMVDINNELVELILELKDIKKVLNNQKSTEIPEIDFNALTSNVEKFLRDYYGLEIHHHDDTTTTGRPRRETDTDTVHG